MRRQDQETMDASCDAHHRKANAPKETKMVVMKGRKIAVRVFKCLMLGLALMMIGIGTTLIVGTRGEKVSTMVPLTFAILGVLLIAGVFLAGKWNRRKESNGKTDEFERLASNTARRWLAYLNPFDDWRPR